MTGEIEITDQVFRRCDEESGTSCSAFSFSPWRFSICSLSGPDSVPAIPLQLQKRIEESGTGNYEDIDTEKQVSDERNITAE